jgi:hypothetical protein
MPIVHAETFDGKDIAVVYIAARSAEAKEVERVLSDSGVDFAVDVEPYNVRLLGLFPRQYEGVGFYVLAGQAEFCRTVLREAGLVQGLSDVEAEY